MKKIKDIENLIAYSIKDTKWENLVFAAGGYVRDEILGKEPKDLDLLIDTPNGGLEFAEWMVNNSIAGAKDLCTFPRFGTAKFSIEGHDIESVMPRGEAYTEGSRKPDVFHTSLKDDAFRRDFTINSLFKNISNKCILDFTGRGLDDIKAGIIATPMNEDLIFNDDPLRMLRAIRFSAQLNFDILDDVFLSIQNNSEKIKNISNERIRDELNKMLISDRPEVAIQLLFWSFLLEHIVPELNVCIGMTQNHYHKDDVFYHTLEVLKNTKPILSQRLMALFHDVGKPLVVTTKDNGEHSFIEHEYVSSKLAEEIMIRLKYSTDEINSVKSGIKNHMRLKHGGKDGLGISDKALRKFKFEVNEKDLDDILDLIHADNISHASEHCLPEQIPVIRERLKNLGILKQSLKLPINGNDLVNELGLKPSKLFNEIFKILIEKVYENPSLTREEALQIAKGMIK